MNSDFENYLLKVTNASKCEEVELIQTLWSDYGKISRYQLDASNNTVVVKFISLNQPSMHPRGWDTENSHRRKIKSYEVETHWYKNWNQQCNSNCITPMFLGAFSKGHDKLIVLEDLNVNFPLRKQQLEYVEVKACLKWLANFHVTFLNQIPNGLWKVGTYWHLETRPDEFKKLTHQELKSKAKIIDERLNQCTYKTIVHGDAKLANFCFSNDGKDVSAVDFQYVGGGCGMKDVAYFLGSCLTSDECEMHQDDLLNYYFAEFEQSLNRSLIDIDFKDLEQEWRCLFPFACADFTRFLLGWMPSHQKVNKYHLNILESVLLDL